VYSCWKPGENQPLELILIPARYEKRTPSTRTSMVCSKVDTVAPLINSLFLGKFSKMFFWEKTFFTFKSILRQKKNYGNSNISPCKNITFKSIL
jgi:hypothetical protein